MRILLHGALAVGLAALAACQGQGEPPAPSGGAAGDMGAGYCDAPPAQADQLDHWNQMCAPTGPRR